MPAELGTARGDTSKRERHILLRGRTAQRWHRQKDVRVGATAVGWRCREGAHGVSFCVLQAASLRKMPAVRFIGYPSTAGLHTKLCCLL